MKTTSLLFIVVILSCCQSQETLSNRPFTFKEAAGFWVPYEVKQDDGSVFTEGLQMFDFFAPYTGSVKLNEDKTYFPFIYTNDKSDYYLREDSSGTVELINDQLFFKSFDSLWQVDFKIIRFTGEELWLSGINWQAKFKKKT